MKVHEREHEVWKQKGINRKTSKKNIYIMRNSQFVSLPEIIVTHETDRQDM